MIPYIHDDVILLGHSQGGIFLAKYLSKNKFPCKIGKLFLVAAPYKDTPNIGSFAFNGSLEKVSEQCEKIHLYFSKDDPIVPFSEMEKYANDLPSAKKHVFEDRGHFIIEEFPEIVEEIRDL